MADGTSGAGELGPVEIPLRGKYRTAHKGSQRSRGENNPNHKRTKAKGDVLKEARAQTAAHRPTLVLEGGVHRRWVRPGE